MENRIVCSRVYLDGKEYTKIHNIKTGERSVVILQDNNSRRYVLKLINDKMRDVEMWRQAYKLSYEKFSGPAPADDMLNPEIRIPRALAEYNDIRCNCGSAYGILFDHIEGNSLETTMHETVIHDLLKICESIILILQYVNRNLQYYHMDISPSNIIIDPEGNAWLIDFEGAYTVNANGNILVCSSFVSRRIYELINMTPHEYEAEQCRMIIGILENRLGADTASRLIKQCESSNSPLEQLHSYIHTCIIDSF